MKKTVLKKKVENLLNELPDQADWDDVMYKIYVRQSIEQGLKDVEEDKTVPHDDIKEKYQWAQ